jgi:ribosomal protein L11 methyltransferase
MLTRIGAEGVSVSDPEEILSILKDPSSLAYADSEFFDSLGTDVFIRAYFPEFAEGIRIGVKSSDIEFTSDLEGLYATRKTETIPVEDVFQIIKQRMDEIATFLPVGKGEISYIFVKDEDWENNWKKDYKSFRISDRAVISPSWENYEPQKGETVIFLDPGSAFGTGTHETTAMCAQILDGMLQKEDIVLDLGCGSGILSILCNKLGAAYVEAIDIDRMAIDVATENIQINKSLVYCHAGELSDALRKDYSLIVANIIADVLISLCPSVPDYLVNGGKIILSGIIVSKKDKVLKEYLDAGFLLLDSRNIGDWHSFVFERA